MTFKPMKKRCFIDIDVSYLHLAPGHYITIQAGDYSIEIIHKDDGAFQVCVDDETFESGIHRYEDIYGPDPFKTKESLDST